MPTSVGAWSSGCSGVSSGIPHQRRRGGAGRRARGVSGPALRWGDDRRRRRYRRRSPFGRFPTLLLRPGRGAARMGRAALGARHGSAGCPGAARVRRRPGRGEARRPAEVTPAPSAGCRCSWSAGLPRQGGCLRYPFAAGRVTSTLRPSGSRSDCRGAGTDGRPWFDSSMSRPVLNKQPKSMCLSRCLHVSSGDVGAEVVRRAGHFAEHVGIDRGDYVVRVNDRQNPPRHPPPRPASTTPRAQLTGHGPSDKLPTASASNAVGELLGGAARRLRRPHRGAGLASRRSTPCSPSCGRAAAPAPRCSTAWPTSSAAGAPPAGGPRRARHHGRPPRRDGPRRRPGRVRPHRRPGPRLHRPGLRGPADLRTTRRGGRAANVRLGRRRRPLRRPRPALHPASRCRPAAPASASTGSSPPSAPGPAGDGGRSPVVVTIMDGERLADYQTMVTELRDAGIPAELYPDQRSFQAQLSTPTAGAPATTRHRRFPGVRRRRGRGEGPRPRRRAAKGIADRDEVALRPARATHCPHADLVATVAEIVGRGTALCQAARAEAATMATTEPVSGAFDLAEEQAVPGRALAEASRAWFRSAGCRPVKPPILEAGRPFLDRLGEEDPAAACTSSPTRAATRSACGRR